MAEKLALIRDLGTRSIQGNVTPKSAQVSRHQMRYNARWTTKCSRNDPIDLNVTLKGNRLKVFCNYCSGPCTPPCQNGGQCINNHCKCTPGLYEGTSCQTGN